MARRGRGGGRRARLGRGRRGWRRRAGRVERQDRAVGAERQGYLVALLQRRQGTLLAVARDGERRGARQVIGMLRAVGELRDEVAPRDAHDEPIHGCRRGRRRRRGQNDGSRRRRCQHSDHEHTAGQQRDCPQQETHGVERLLTPARVPAGTVGGTSRNRLGAGTACPAPARRGSRTVAPSPL